MNFGKNILLTLILMICCVTSQAYAQANTNCPYCNHDPACWEPNDDPSLWWSGQCCHRKEQPPHPDPDDLCWGYNWDNCKWERKTPDCQWYEDKHTQLTIYMVTLMKRLLFWKMKMNGAKNDEERAAYQQEYNSVEWFLDVADRNRNEVQKDWEDCLKCKIK